MSNPSPSHFFEGYAVVSADGYIADADGDMPGSLRFDADWTYFQSALDRTDLTLIGRHTHEAAPNVKGRRRMVFSRRIKEEVVQEDGNTTWIDPAKADPNAAITKLFGRVCHVAVVGGQGVFDWVLANPGFSEVHLSVAHRVRLGQGQRMFGEAPDLLAIFSLLEGRGMVLAHRAWFDREVGLELLVYKQM